MPNGAMKNTTEDKEVLKMYCSCFCCVTDLSAVLSPVHDNRRLLLMIRCAGITHVLKVLSDTCDHVTEVRTRPRPKTLIFEMLS